MRTAVGEGERREARGREGERETPGGWRGAT
jgi:hypothetical protein